MRTRVSERCLEFVRAFIAGFVSTLVFHQGLLTVLYLTHVVSRAPYDLRAVPPLSIPAVISLAFWGGAWGMAIWPLVRNMSGPAYWLGAVVISAIVSGSVTLFIVSPLKGVPLAGGWSPKIIVSTLLLNGTWGLGMALLMYLMGGQTRLSNIPASTPRTDLGS